jgi:anhydro-N-acetylmuramic acid kinase
VDPIRRLAGIASKPVRLGLGLMSGMSMDGLDLALLRIEGAEPGRKVTLVASETVPYGTALSARIRGAVGGSAREASLLSRDLAEWWAARIAPFLARAGVEAGEVDFIGSHGQTIDHLSRAAGGGVAATLQVGDGCLIAERTGIPVVSDFRRRDIAAGGEGAPLVPFADWLLHARPGEVSACHNLGNISNLTVVTPRAEDVVAFDTGPANALIDALARCVPGNPDGIDLDGGVSARGSVDDIVLRRLLDGARGYLERPPPKSAGFDEFGPRLAESVVAWGGGARPEDLVRTAVEFTARTVADAYRRFVLPRHPGLSEARFAGGGVRNRTLMARIGALLAEPGVRATPFDDAWAKAKEAAAFALLADELLAGRPGNLPGATGASRPVLLGKISP